MCSSSLYIRFLMIWIYFVLEM